MLQIRNTGRQYLICVFCILYSTVCGGGGILFHESPSLPTGRGETYLITLALKKRLVADVKKLTMSTGTVHVNFLVAEGACGLRPAD